MKPFVLLASVLLASVLLPAAFAAPASAQAPVEPSGRYQIAPNEDGFVRLDTETGAMAHCSRQEGAWRCEMLAEDDAAVAERLDRLAGDLDAATRKLDDLAARLDRLETRAPAAFPDEKELDEAMNFFGRLMDRFFDMVRQFKGEEPAQRI